MRHYYDGNGRYQGRSVGAGSSGAWRALGGLITLALVGWLVFWPAVQIGGFMGWTLTGFWWILLILAFLFIGYLIVRKEQREEQRQQRLQERYQPRHSSGGQPPVRPAPGPRDWEAPGHGDWQQGVRHF